MSLAPEDITILHSAAFYFLHATRFPLRSIEHHPSNTANTAPLETALHKQTGPGALTHSTPPTPLPN